MSVRGSSPGERRPLSELTACEAAASLERDVGLRVQPVAVEDHEPGVDSSPAERLDVRPRNARGVHGAVDDAQRHGSHSSWSKKRSAVRPGRTRDSQRCELVVRDLPERALHAEVREVQVLLVDDRRDARVDLDHEVAHELDVEEVLDREARDDPVRELHEAGIVERDEVHGEAGAHRLSRLRVTEDDAVPVGDAVDRALAALRELHHEQVRAALGGEELERLLEAHRDRARALVQQLLRPVDARVEHAEAARARGHDGLEAHRAIRVAELAAASATAAPPRTRSNLGAGGRAGAAPRSSAPCRSTHESASGPETRTRAGAKSWRRSARASRSKDDWGSTTSTSSRSDELEHRVDEGLVSARRDELEGVAEVPADGSLGHVGPDEAKLPLAVLAERADERRRPRRPHALRSTVIGRRLTPSRRVDVVGRELLEAARLLGVQHRSHRQSHGRALVDPDLRVHEDLEPREPTPAELLVRAAGAPVLVRVRAIRRRVEVRLRIDVDRAGDRRRHVLGARVVPGDDAIEALVEVEARVDCVQADRVAEVAEARHRFDALARGEVVEDRLGHEEVGRAHVLLRLELGHAQRRVEREVDVVAEEDVAALGALLEEAEAVAAGLRRVEDLRVVRELEVAAHAAASTSTSSSVAACSARRSASVGRVRDRDHVAAAVAVAAHGPDRLAELQVRVRLDDAFCGENPVEAADPRDAAGRERARARREEADRERLPEPREGDLVRDLLAERLPQRDLDEVDADGMADEVRHLPARDASGDLDDRDRAVGRGDELRERDRVSEAERAHRRRLRHARRRRTCAAGSEGG